MLIWMFVAISIIAAAVYAMLSGSVSGFADFWKPALMCLGCFAVLNVGFVLFYGLAGLFVNTTKPIPKQSVLFRFGCYGVGHLICSYSWVRTHITGLEKLPQGQHFLMVCNHRSMYDPLVVLDKLQKFNISFVSKPSNMMIPVAGTVSYGAGFLPIDRDNDRKALKTILTAANYIKKGICSMAIYPEGTRSKTGELLPFHPGSFKIAQKAEAPIVVACVRGTENVSKNIFRRPTDVYLDILDVISAEDVKNLSTSELATISHSLIAARLAA